MNSVKPENLVVDNLYYITSLSTDDDNNIIGKTLWIKNSLRKISNSKIMHITPHEVEPENIYTNDLWIDMFDQFLEFLQNKYQIDLSKYYPGFYYYSICKENT